MVASKDVPESEILHEILSARPDPTKPLHKLSDLRSYRAWDYSWPTLTAPRRFTKRHTYANDDDLFETIELHNEGVTHGLLEVVGALDEDNHVVLYGGALVDVILGREESIRDWDLRLVGQKYVDDQDACVRAAKDFVANVIDWIKKQNAKIKAKMEDGEAGDNVYRRDKPFPINKVQTSRTASTVTVVVPGRQSAVGFLTPTVLQFTFAPYASVRDLLASSTPHCSRLAVKDHAVVLDAAAKYCLESLCVVLDVQSFRFCQFASEEEKDDGSDASKLDVERQCSMPTRMRRVQKYYAEKGFDIILPNLDISKLPRRNLKFGLKEVLDLPELTVIYSSVEGKKIMVDELRLPGSPTQRDDGGCHDGYDGTLNFQIGETVHHNIRCLVADVYNRFRLVTEGQVTDPVFDYAPLLTGRMIDKSYETVRESLLLDNISITKIQQYFSATSPPDVLEKYVLARMRSAAKRRWVPGSFEPDKDALDELISLEKDALLGKLKTLRQKMQAAGLDQLVVDFSKSSSPDDVVLKAIYGDYLLG